MVNSMGLQHMHFFFPTVKVASFVGSVVCTCGISLACLGSTRGNLGQGFLNCMGIGGKVSIPYKMFFALYRITYNCSRFFFGVIFDTLMFQGFGCFLRRTKQLCEVTTFWLQKASTKKPHFHLPLLPYCCCLCQGFLFSIQYSHATSG